MSGFVVTDMKKVDGIALVRVCPRNRCRICGLPWKTQAYRCCYLTGPEDKVLMKSFRFLKIVAAVWMSSEDQPRCYFDNNSQTCMLFICLRLLWSWACLTRSSSRIRASVRSTRWIWDEMKESRRDWDSWSGGGKSRVSPGRVTSLRAYIVAIYCGIDSL